MRILCSNDDGVHARGLQVLEQIALELSNDVWIVAPERDQSGVGRAVSLHDPLRVRQVTERKFALSGTPTDCVHWAVKHLLPKDGKAPDLVLSGVNNGQNIGDDVTVSGTLAAAFHGMTLGIASVALSLARLDKDSRPHWETPRARAPDILRRLLDFGWPKDVILNINFPGCEAAAVGSVEITRQNSCAQHAVYLQERTDLRGKLYFWYGFEKTFSKPLAGTDLRAIYDRNISVTPLHLQLSHDETVENMATLFK